MKPDGEIKINYRKKPLIIAFLLGVIFCLMALHFIFYSNQLAQDCNTSFNSKCFNNPVGYQILGWITMIFFGMGDLVILFLFIKNPVIMTIKEQGIVIPEGMIEWKNITQTEICEVAGKCYLRFTVNKACVDNLRSRYNRFQRYLASSLQGDTFSYPVSDTNIDIDKLYEYVNTCITKNKPQY